MTDTERAELKRLAEAATKGPWSAALCAGDEEGWLRGANGLFMTTGYEGEMRAADVRYIAAANPAAVLDLLREHEEDQGVIAVWRGRTERAEAEIEERKAGDADLRGRLKRQVDATYEQTCRAKAAEAENERLKAEIRAALTKHRFTGKTPEADAVNEVLVSIARDLHIAHEDT